MLDPYAGSSARRDRGETATDRSLLLTVPEAARLLRISRGLAYELIAEGKLPAVRLGRVIRVPRHSLEQWIGRQAGLPQAVPEAVSFPQQPAQRH